MPVSINGNTGVVTGVAVGGLPDGIVDTDMLAAGAVTSAKRGAGAILQVVQTTKTDTASTNSTSEADLVTLAITPTASSSKILLFVDLKLGSSSPSSDPIIRLYRDSTQIYMGDADGNRGRSMFGADEYDSYNNAQWLLKCVQGNYLDSPSTASQITYKITWRIVDTNHTLYLNRTGNDSNHVNYPRTASSIIAMEVAG